MIASSRERDAIRGRGVPSKLARRQLSIRNGHRGDSPRRMILNHTEVDQIIDRDARGSFIKELVIVRTRSKSGVEVPLSMVRKRRAGASETRAPVLLIHGYGQNRYAWHLPSRSLSNHLAQAGFD